MLDRRCLHRRCSEPLPSMKSEELLYSVRALAKKSGDDLAIHGGPVTGNIAPLLEVNTASKAELDTSYIPQLMPKIVGLSIDISCAVLTPIIINE